MKNMQTYRVYTGHMENKIISIDKNMLHLLKEKHVKESFELFPYFYEQYLINLWASRSIIYPNKHELRLTSNGVFIFKYTNLHKIVKCVSQAELDHASRSMNSCHSLNIITHHGKLILIVHLCVTYQKFQKAIRLNNNNKKELHCKHLRRDILHMHTWDTAS